MTSVASQEYLISEGPPPNGDGIDWWTGESKLRELVMSKDVALREAHHRVSNSLQIIGSILALQARDVQSDDARMHLRDAQQRILAVATAQREISGTRNGRRAEIGAYLSRLCETLASSLIDESRPVRLVLQAQAGTASSDELSALGAIVAELVINALKHAFVDDTIERQIVVAWTPGQSNWKLSVRDNGTANSNRNSSPLTSGHGAKIVAALASQLCGRVETSIEPNGTTVSISGEGSLS
jgi:chemotaxis protein methyltransferase CheR